MLEQRDSYFTTLMQTIKLASDKNDGQPVVLMAHSLGNKTVHYFLNWVVNTQPDGQAFLDRYVQSLFAIAAPFLGSCEAFKANTMGENFGVGAFLSADQTQLLNRSCFSGAGLFPIGPLGPFEDYRADVAYTRFEGRLTVDVVVARVVSRNSGSAGDITSLGFDVEHDKTKHHVSRRSKLSARTYVKDGRAEFHRRYQFVTNATDPSKATGETLRFRILVDKQSPRGACDVSLPLDAWFGVAKATTQHHRAKTLDHILHRRHRHTEADMAGQVGELSSASSELSSASSAPDTPSRLLVATVDDESLLPKLAQAGGGGGGGGATQAVWQNTTPPQPPEFDRFAFRKHRHTAGSGQLRAHPRILKLPLESSGLVAQLRRAARDWCADRWYNMRLEPACFHGNDVVEWMRRWLFERQLPHCHHEAAALATRLMQERVIEPIDDAERGTPWGHQHHAQAHREGEGLEIEAHGLYRLALPTETTATASAALLPAAELTRASQKLCGSSPDPGGSSIQMEASQASKLSTAGTLTVTIEAVQELAGSLVDMNGDGGGSRTADAIADDGDGSSEQAAALSGSSAGCSGVDTQLAGWTHVIGTAVGKARVRGVGGSGGASRGAEAAPAVATLQLETFPVGGVDVARMDVVGGVETKVSSGVIRLVEQRRYEAWELRAHPVRMRSACSATAAHRGGEYQLRVGLSWIPKLAKLHVRQIGVHGWDGTAEGVGAYESETALAGLFDRFDSFVRATVRHRVEAGRNTSWAIVTMSSADAAERALSAASSADLLAGDTPLHVERFSALQADASDGAMAQSVRDQHEQHVDATAAAHAVPPLRAMAAHDDCKPHVVAEEGHPCATAHPLDDSLSATDPAHKLVRYRTVRFVAENLVVRVFALGFLTTADQIHGSLPKLPLIE
jgi:hypothetical protein